MVNNVPFGTMVITGNYPVNGVSPAVKTPTAKPATAPMMRGVSTGRDTIEFTAVAQAPVIEDDPTGLKNMPNPFNL